MNIVILWLSSNFTREHPPPKGQIDQCGRELGLELTVRVCSRGRTQNAGELGHQLEEGRQGAQAQACRSAPCFGTSTVSTPAQFGTGTGTI